MIGEQLGSWTIDRPLGQGGMGNVYLAHESVKGADRQAAIKVLHAGLAKEAGFLERFSREIDTLRKLHDEHIVQFFDCGVHRGQPWYAMEYVAGPPLADVLAERGPLPWDEVVKIGIQVCKALQLAHQQELIHRDLKPANLLLTADGTVKLADFGIAKVFRADSLTDDNVALGTPDFIAPEQAMGRPVTKRTDLYSLGVVLYQLLTGRLPFLAETSEAMVHQHKYGTFDPPSKFVKDLPHELDTLIGELLAKEPEKRPGSAAIVADQLGRLQRKMVRKRQHTVDLVRNAPTKVMPEAADEQAGAKAKGRFTFPESRAMEQTPWVRVGLLSLALVVVIGLVWWGLRPPSPEKLLADAETAIAAGNWSDAETALDKLKKKHPTHAFMAKATELETQVATGKDAAKARRDAGAFAVTPPTCEAERLYRKGVVEYLGGRTEEAHRTWRETIAAYEGIVKQESWVKLARQALMDAGKAGSPIDSVKSALEKAEKEDRATAEKRLTALLALYQNERHQPDLAPLLDEIQNRLKKLR